MIIEKEEIVNEIKTLANSLDKFYAKKTSFRNHCYLRIAYDNAIGTKWDKTIERPYIKNANVSQLRLSLKNLIRYQNDFDKLLIDNKTSLKYRNKL